MAAFGSDDPFSIFGGLPITPPTKRAVFVSYHHDGDQAFYNQFSTFFGGVYRIIRDNSLRQEIWSDDAEYIMRRIREDYLAGTSCTIVLCGRETPWRKFVDWEIKATLDKNHGLLGIGLPTNPVISGNVRVPDRFFDNYNTGYAVWLDWWQLFVNQQARVEVLRHAIEDANSRPKSAIENRRSLRSRNADSPYP